MYTDFEDPYYYNPFASDWDWDDEEEDYDDDWDEDYYSD